MVASRSSAFAIALMVVFLGFGSGCATGTSTGANLMARVDALLKANAHAEALRSIDRIQRRRDIDPALVADSTLARAQALAGLGRRSEAVAHYRFVADHHPQTTAGRAARTWLAENVNAGTPSAGSSTPVPAAVAEDAGSVAGTSVDEGSDSFDLADWGFLTEVEVQIPGMQYPKRAVERQIEGVVEVAFQVEEDGRVQQIAILNDPHPMLMSEVIRAIAAAEIDPVMLGLADRSAFPVKRRTKVSFFLER